MIFTPLSWRQTWLPLVPAKRGWEACKKEKASLAWPVPFSIAVPGVWYIPSGTLMIRPPLPLMDSFYANLAEGIPKDRALQKAKKSFLKNNRETALAHPYYWSGFIIQGNTLPLPVRSYTYLYILGIGLVLWMLWFFRKHLLKLFA